jgi:hypothetical protein
MSQNSTAYRLRVAQYLASPLGASTSNEVACRLLALRPASIDMSEDPSVPELHSLRAFLDAWDAPENDQLTIYDSGLHLVELDLDGVYASGAYDAS